MKKLKRFLKDFRLALASAMVVAICFIALYSWMVTHPVTAEEVAAREARETNSAISKALLRVKASGNMAYIPTPNEATGKDSERIRLCILAAQEYARLHGLETQSWSLNRSEFAIEGICCTFAPSRNP